MSNDAPLADRSFPRSILIPLSDLELGGTERIAIRLANAWAREGVAVTLFCGEDRGALAPLVDRDSVRVVTPERPIARGPGSRQRLGKAAARLAARTPFDACFIPGNFHWPAIRPLARLRAHRPVIVAQVSAAIAKPQRQGFRRRLFELALRSRLARADAVVTLSDAARADLALLAPSILCRTIPLPALQDDEPPPVPAHGDVVLGVGRLVPEKGFGELVRAVANLKRPVQLRIAGEGPEAENLRRLADDLGILNRVELLGYIADVRPLFRSARLFVLASHFEGYAAVIVEALAAGLPVVATDCTPAVDELLTDATVGRSVPLGDIAAMTAAIDRMLDQSPPDPQALARSVDGYHIGPVARAYLALFADAR